MQMRLRSVGWARRIKTFHHPWICRVIMTAASSTVPASVLAFHGILGGFGAFGAQHMERESGCRRLPWPVTTRTSPSRRSTTLMRSRLSAIDLVLARAPSQSRSGPDGMRWLKGCPTMRTLRWSASESSGDLGRKGTGMMRYPHRPLAGRCSAGALFRCLLPTLISTADIERGAVDPGTVPHLNTTRTENHSVKSHHHLLTELMYGEPLREVPPPPLDRVDQAVQVDPEQGYYK